MQSSTIWLAVIEFDRPILSLHLRVAWGNPKNRAKADHIYYDMTDEKSSVVEISPGAWNIVSSNDSSMPILFRRYNQVAQVEPCRNYDNDIFNQFIDLTNVKDKRHKQLLKVYIVSLLIPDIDHPILTTYGPKGAGKILPFVSY